MKKLIIYLRYLFEYLRYGDFISIAASVKYLKSKQSHSKDRVITTSIGTFYCRRRTNDFQFANLMYEWTVKEFIFKYLKSYSVFIDGGACIGDYSILLAKHKLQCFAFEPIEENYRAMMKNLELNGLQSVVKAFPFGLGDANSKAPFIFNPVNTGASRIDRQNREATHTAEIRTLDSIMDQMDVSLNDNILIKLDAEGMEPEILKGAEHFIERYPHMTFIIEDKFTGREALTSILDKYGKFEYGTVDEFNMYARKIA
ncbi:MAG: FkbM family methyltransferase [Bacteroidales bacterium]|nr:FkbM family methyltransferase [Bacteroidales bacterium]